MLAFLHRFICILYPEHTSFSSDVGSVPCVRAAIHTSEAPLTADISFEEPLSLIDLRRSSIADFVSRNSANVLYAFSVNTNSGGTANLIDYNEA